MKKKLSAISSLTFGLFKLISVVLASLIGNFQPTILIGSLLNFNIIFPSPNVGFFSLISSSIWLLYFFIFETILLAKALKINPYDQPSVELIKTETKKILTSY